MAKLTKIFSPKKDKLAPPEPLQMPLRIVRAGGIVESYYMAVPAARVLERHPRSVLARPEVFRRPWESVVSPDEILTPGEKLYLVPRGTLRKLQQRLRRAATGWEMERSLCASTSTAVGPAHPGGRKKVRFLDTWQPSLVAIAESSSTV